MADEKRQIILDLLARNKMRKDTNEAADDLDRLGKSAEEADKKSESLGKTNEETEKKTDELGKTTTVVAGRTEELGKATEETSKQTDKLGGSLDKTKGRISDLDSRIENLNKELGGMAAAWTDASTAAEKADLSKSIRKTQTELRTTKKQRGVLADILPDDDEQQSWVKRFQQNTSSGFKAIGDSLMPILITAGVAAAPAIGATLSGAITGGVGLGGIVGGFLIASKDARVKSAIDAMKTSIGNELKTAALPFTDVAIDAVGKFGKAIKGINTQQLFKDAAQQAGPLIDGVTDLITKLGNAFVDVVHESGPEVAAIGKGLSQIGGALAAGLRSLADNADANTDALSNLFVVISGGITVVFGFIDALTKVYEIGRKFTGGGLVDSFHSIMDASASVSGKLDDMTSSAVAAVTGTEDLAKAQKDSERAATGQRDALKAVSDELKKQTDPAFAVLDATDQVKQAQDDAAKAVKKYGSNSEEARAASRKLAEAALDLQGDVGALGSTFDGHLSPSMRRTLTAAGLTKSQIKGVETELKRAKSAADAYAGRYVADIITNYTYNVGGNDYNREANRGAFSGKRAAGGPIVRGVPYLVGENGPEIVVPDASGRVLNASGSRGLMASGAMTGMQSNGSQGGFTGGVLQLEVKPGSDQKVATLINGLIRTGMIQLSVVGA